MGDRCPTADNGPCTSYKEGRGYLRCDSHFAGGYPNTVTRELSAARAWLSRSEREARAGRGRASHQNPCRWISLELGGNNLAKLAWGAAVQRDGDRLVPEATR